MPVHTICSFTKVTAQACEKKVNVEKRQRVEIACFSSARFFSLSKIFRTVFPNCFKRFPFYVSFACEKSRFHASDETSYIFSRQIVVLPSFFLFLPPPKQESRFDTVLVRICFGYVGKSLKHVWKTFK